MISPTGPFQGQRYAASTSHPALPAPALHVDYVRTEVYEVSLAGATDDVNEQAVDGTAFAHGDTDLGTSLSRGRRASGTFRPTLSVPVRGARRAESGSFELVTR